MGIFGKRNSKIIIGSAAIVATASFASIAAAITTTRFSSVHDSSSTPVSKYSELNKTTLSYEGLVILSTLSESNMISYISSNENKIITDITNLLGDDAKNVDISFNNLSTSITPNFEQNKCIVNFDVYAKQGFEWKDGTTDKKTLVVNFNNVKQEGTNDVKEPVVTTYSNLIELTSLDSTTLNTFLNENTNFNKISEVISGTNLNMNFAYKNGSASVDNNIGTLKVVATPVSQHYWNDYSNSAKEVEVKLSNLKQNSTTGSKFASFPTDFTYSEQTINISNFTSDEINKFIDNNPTFLTNLISKLNVECKNINIKSSIQKSLTLVNGGVGTIYLNVSPSADCYWEDGSTSSKNVPVKINLRKITDDQKDAKIATISNFYGVVNLKRLDSNGLQNFEKWKDNSNFFNEPSTRKLFNNELDFANVDLKLQENSAVYNSFNPSSSFVKLTATPNENHYWTDGSNGPKDVTLYMLEASSYKLQDSKISSNITVTLNNPNFMAQNMAANTTWKKDIEQTVINGSIAKVRDAVYAAKNVQYLSYNANDACWISRERYDGGIEKNTTFLYTIFVKPSNGHCWAGTENDTSTRRIIITVKGFNVVYRYGFGPHLTFRR